MLAELLKVKRLREEDAEKVVRVAQTKLAAARDAVRAAEDAVERHHNYRLSEEQRLFDEIKGEAVTLARIDEMKLAISILRETEMNLESALETARQAVPSLEGDLHEAEAEHREAMATSFKFEELVTREANAAARAAVAREDAEIEEVTEVMFGGGRPVGG